MSRAGNTVVYVELTVAEREEVRRLQHTLGIDTVGNMIRQALWNLAEEAGQSCDIALRRTYLPGRPRKPRRNWLLEQQKLSESA